MYHQRGTSVCKNNQLILRDDLERRLLQRLQEAVLRDEVLDYAVERLREASAQTPGTELSIADPAGTPHVRAATTVEYSLPAYDRRLRGSRRTELKGDRHGGKKQNGAGELLIHLDGWLPIQ
jgi:hypothetical protein